MPDIRCLYLRLFVFLIAVGGLLLAPSRASAALLPPRVYNDGLGHSMPYRVFTPINYDPAKKYPLITFMHGAGFGGTNNVDQLQLDAEGLYGNTQSNPNFACFLVFPQAPSNMNWSDWRLDLQIDIIDALKVEFSSIDPRRLNVAGVSMGGNGVWNMLERHPGYFASAMPVAGYYNGDNATLASAIKDENIWAWHGRNDDIIPVSETREIIAALQAVGGDPLYTETGHDHNLCSVVWAERLEVYPWILSQTLVVPEPSTATLGGIGGLALLLFGMRKRRRKFFA